MFSQVAHNLHNEFTIKLYMMAGRNFKNIVFLFSRWSQFSSVTQSCPTLCDPMNHSTPGLPVPHQHPKFTHTHVNRLSEAIQPSHPLVPFSSWPQSLPASGSFPMSQLFARGGKVLEFQLRHHSFQRNPRADLLHNGLVGSPCSPRDSQESSPTPQFKSSNSLVLRLHSPTLTSIHDYWKNHNLDLI